MRLQRARPAPRDASKQFSCLLPAVCCLLVAAGCSNGKRLQADLYQRELRLQEDEIYRLEDCLEQYQSIVRGQRREITKLKQRLGGEPSGVEPVPDIAEPAPADLEFSPGAAPRRDGGGDQNGQGLDFLPAPDADEAPGFTPTAAATRGRARLASLESDSVEPPSPPRLLRIGEVDSVRLEARNGPPGASGEPTLVARITPISDGAPAYFEGEASVLLADLGAEGPLRRIARWDFTADEVERAWVESNDDTRLELPLLAPFAVAGKTPAGRPLRLWVRLVDAQGRKTLRSVEAEFASQPFRLVEKPRPEAPESRPRRFATPDAERIAAADEGPTWRRAVPGRRDRPSDDGGVRPASFEFSARQ